jgi:hypothetical protein
VPLQRVAISQNIGGHRPTNSARRSAFPAVVLVDGLGADPQRDAQGDARERRSVRVPAAESGDGLGGARARRVGTSTASSTSAARVFGFEYETLPGHLEIGRRDYEVLEFLDDGAVQFRQHARSRVSGEGLGGRGSGSRAGAFLVPVLRADRAADRVLAGTARSDPAAGGVAADADAAAVELS